MARPLPISRLPHARLMLAGFCLFLWTTAPLKAESEKEKAERIKRETPPLRCSAWGAFRNFQSTEQQAKIEEKDRHKTLHTRPNSQFWSSYGRRGEWTAIVVELQNTTEKEIYRGEINLRLDPGDLDPETNDRTYKASYRQSFEIGPASTKRFRFSVYGPHYNFNGVSVPILVTAGGRSFQRSVRLDDLDAGKRQLVVVVSDRDAAFKFLTIRPSQGFAASSDTEISGREVAVVRVEDLPERWHDLTLVDLLIVDGPPRERFTETQLAALETYVLNGGRLLITAGIDPARLRTAEGERLGLDRLAGIEVLGASAFKRLGMARNFEFSGELAAVEVRAIQNHLILNIDRNPESGAIERKTRDLGMGSVTFLSFSLSDPLLEGWHGRMDLPAAILRTPRALQLFDEAEEEIEERESSNFAFYNTPQPQQARTQLGRLRVDLDESFAKDTPVDIPKPKVVGTFMVIFLFVAVVGNFLVFSWMRRREAAWLTVPLWAAVFSAAAYSFVTTGNLMVTQLSVVEAGSGQSQGVARTFAGLYSPRRDFFQIDFENEKYAYAQIQGAASHLISPLFRARGIGDRLPEISLLEKNERMLLHNFMILARGTQRIEVAHKVDLQEGLQVELSTKGFQELLTAINGTSFRLFNAAVLRYRTNGYEGYALGDLEKGERIERNLAENAQRLTIEQALLEKTVSLPSNSGLDSVRRKEYLCKYLRAMLDKANTSLFLAWIDDGLLPIAIDEGKPGINRGFSLLIVPLNVRGEGGVLDFTGGWRIHTPVMGGSIFAPGEVKNWVALSKKGTFTERGSGGNNTQHTLLKLTLPPQTTALSNLQFELAFDLVAEQVFRSAYGSQAAVANAKVPRNYKLDLNVEAFESGGGRPRWTSFMLRQGIRLNLDEQSQVNIQFQMSLTDRYVASGGVVFLRISCLKIEADAPIHAEASGYPLVIQNLKPSLTNTSGAR